jgi:hypothetical protein
MPCPTGKYEELNNECKFIMFTVLTSEPRIWLALNFGHRALISEMTEF